MTMPADLLPPASFTPKATDEELLPIREVVRLSGVNPVTLRAWERRYGLIQPVRTEGGHRLYSLADVERIRTIITWTERGVAVSKVASLLAAEAQAATEPVDDATPLTASGQTAAWLEWQTAIRQSVESFAELRLQQLYGQLFASYPLEQVFNEVLMPLWHELVHCNGFGQHSQWLTYDAFLRAQAWQRLQFARRSETASVLFAALPDACRELELLVAGLLLDGGKGQVRVLPLGQPLDELPLVCQLGNPEALVLFAPAPILPALLNKIIRLSQAIDCPVGLAGIGAELAGDQLRGSPLANLGKHPSLMASRLQQFIAGRLDT